MRRRRRRGKRLLTRKQRASAGGDGEVGEAGGGDAGATMLPSWQCQSNPNLAAQWPRLDAPNSVDLSAEPAPAASEEPSRPEPDRNELRPYWAAEPAAEDLATRPAAEQPSVETHSHPDGLPEPGADATPERARRGSTVREPANFAVSGRPPSAVPEPEQSSSSTPELPPPPAESRDEPEPPRRTGWWSRRFASNKS